MDIDIDRLMSDKEAFNAFIYTPLEEAIRQLSARSGNEAINRYIDNLPTGVPEILKDKQHAVLFRHIATPNFETRRFVSIIDGIPELTPAFIEYHQDKFLTRNKSKFALAKLGFHQGRNKLGGNIVAHKNVIAFNESNAKKISELTTTWGQGLVDFHHEFLHEQFLNKINASPVFFDASDWIRQAGGTPAAYYEVFFSCFLKDNVLFENFLLDKDEFEFTKTVILPAFIKVYAETGVKPLIVALEPTDIEGDEFWLMYPPESAEFIKTRQL